MSAATVESTTEWPGGAPLRGPEQPGIRLAVLAVSTIFFVVGCAFATWAARVPAIQENLGLSSGQLAIALLGFNGGVVLAPPLAGGLVMRGGSRTVLGAGLVVYLGALPLLGLAPGQLWLAGALLLLALGNTAVDVAMNTQGVLVERACRKPLLGRFHAMFSLGGLAGAGIGSLAAHGDVPVAVHFGLVAGVLALLGGLASTQLLPDGPSLERQPGLVLPSRGLLTAGAICFCALMGEGAMNDWGAVYLRNVAGTDQAIAAAGFGVFSLGMVLSRLCADPLRKRLGVRRFVEACGLVSLSGSALAVGLAAPIPGLAGSLLLGLGMGGIVPVVFSHTAHRHPDRAAHSIAAVTTLGYSGFFVGPLVIGGIAEASSLRVAMLTLPALGLATTALARRLRTT